MITEARQPPVSRRQTDLSELCKLIYKLYGDRPCDGNEYELRHAAYNGNLNSVKRLIALGADIHAYDEESLRFAVINGHIDVVRVLIDAGADIHADNNLSFELAEFNGHFDILKLLKTYLVNKVISDRIIKLMVTQKI